MTMNLRISVVVLSMVAVACGPNTVSSGNGGGTAATGGGDASAAGGGSVDANPYPAGPYGANINKVIPNFALPGYFSTTADAIVNDNPQIPALDLQSVREAVDANGNPFRFLLLDISAGWCDPCNQEAQALGLNGTDKGKIDEWLGKGGIVLTVLAEGYDESTHAAPLATDLDKWINSRKSQVSTANDPTQAVEGAGISNSAFPANLVIDLSTMKIISAWYGDDTTYQKWEAALNGGQ